MKAPSHNHAKSLQTHAKPLSHLASNERRGASLSHEPPKKRKNDMMK